MTEPSHDLRTSLQARLTEMEQLADEIRVRVHLAGMDAKDAWGKLEPALDDARQHVKEASESSKKAIEDLFEAFRKLRASL